MNVGLQADRRYWNTVSRSSSVARLPQMRSVTRFFGSDSMVEMISLIGVIPACSDRFWPEASLCSALLFSWCQRLRNRWIASCAVAPTRPFTRSSPSCSTALSISTESCQSQSRSTSWVPRILTARRNACSPSRRMISSSPRYCVSEEAFLQRSDKAGAESLVALLGIVEAKFAQLQGIVLWKVV